MLDILVAIVEELFGVEKKNKAKPRRDMRGGSGGAAPGQTQPNFDDFVKQLLGGGAPAAESARTEEEEYVPPPPPPPPVQRRQQPKPARPPKPRNAGKKSRQVEEAYKLGGTLEPTAPPPELTGTLSAAQTMSSLISEPLAQPRRDPNPDMPDFVKRLRNNPAAAREAFVYAEIMGPPLADRMERER